MVTTKKIKNHGRWVRRKGHQFERDIAIALRDIFPKARRHLEYQDAEANGIDLVETGRFCIQCKKYKSYVPISTINEVMCDRRLGEIPVLISAGDNLPTMAVLYFEDLKDLMKAKVRQ